MDDLLAYNLRAGLILRLVREPSDDDEEPEDEMEAEARKHREGVSRAHSLGEEIRRVYG